MTTDPNAIRFYLYNEVIQELPYDSDRWALNVQGQLILDDKRYGVQGSDRWADTVSIYMFGPL